MGNCSKVAATLIDSNSPEVSIAFYSTNPNIMYLLRATTSLNSIDFMKSVDGGVTWSAIWSK